MSAIEEGNREILNDIRSYLRITAAAASRATANRIIDSWEKASVYARMDGKTSTYKIAEALGLPQRTVAGWADDFVRANLASPPDEFHQSHRALFSPSELLIEISQLKRKKKGQGEQPPVSGPTLDSQNQITSTEVGANVQR